MIQGEQTVKPGVKIQVTDIIEMAGFEDRIVEQIDPKMSDSARLAWQGRLTIRDQLRIPKFNGPLLGIELECMDEPLARLQDARARGWSLLGGSVTQQRTNMDTLLKRRAPASLALAQERTVGFRLSALAHSGGAVVGPVQSELWYIPVSVTTRRADGRLQKSTKAYGGLSVMRVVARPRFLTEVK